MKEEIVNYIEKDSIESDNFFYYFNDDKILKPNQPSQACYEYLNRRSTYHCNDRFSEIINGVEERLYNTRYTYPDILPYYPYIAINLYNQMLSKNDIDKLYEAFKYLQINAVIRDNIAIWKWEDYGSLFLKSVFLRLLLDNPKYRNTVFRIRKFYPTMSYLKSCILALYNVQIYNHNTQKWAHKTIMDYNMYQYVKQKESYYSFVPIYPRSLSSLKLEVITDIKTISSDKYKYEYDDNASSSQALYPKEYINLFNLFKLDDKVKANVISEFVLTTHNFTLKQLDNLINFLESLKTHLNDDNRIRPRSFHTEQQQPVS